MRDLGFALVWLALLPVSLVSAYVGVLLWVWVALIAPNDMLFGFMSGVPFNKVVALPAIGLAIFGRQRKDAYLDGTLVVVALLALSATVSWLNPIIANDSATDLYIKLLKEIALVFVISVVMIKREHLHLMALIIALALGFLATKEGLISLLTAGGHKIIGSVSIGDNNSLATALLMIIPLLFYLYLHSAVRAVRVSVLVVLGLSVVTVIMTFSRGGFVGLLVLGGYMVKNSKNKFGAVFLVILAGILIYAFAPAAWFSRLDTIETADNDSSFMGRVVAWKISWLIAMDHPLFGGGMHAVQQPFVWDFYKPFLYKLDFVTTPPADVIPHAAHSMYFEVLGDLGFIGLALFLSMLALAFWNCRQTYRMSRQHPSLAWAADLARMMQISLVVYIVTAAALSMAYFELIYIMVALTSRCRRTVRLSLETDALELPDQLSIRAHARPVLTRRPALSRMPGRPH